MFRRNWFFVLFIDLFKYPFTSFNFFFSIYRSIVGDTDKLITFRYQLFKLLRTILLTEVSSSKIRFSIGRLRNFRFWLAWIVEGVQVIGYF